MPHFRFITPQAAPDFHCQRRSSPAAASGFNPLLDLLQAVEAEFTQPSRPEQPKKKTIVPHFDVLETSSAYILEGELPGVADKTSLDIQFKDAQTLIVKGEVSRRNRDEIIDETPATIEKQQAPAVPRSASPTSTEKSFKPTVEDTVDESESGSEHDEFEVVDTPATLKATDRESSSSSATLSAKEATEEPAAKKQQTKSPKYWVNERAVGVFERSFSFQGLIDQDNVKANLANGILEIVVPKREPYVRKIQIQ